MLKTIIKLPDGTEISSGTSTGNSIKTAKLTECVNSGSELTLGSVCSNAVEITLFTPGGNLGITAGDEITVYKQENSKDPIKIGVFILEKPTRPTANTMKLTGYDRVTKLDKDVSVFLNKLTGLYSLFSFAGIICEHCGVKCVTTTAPNSNFLVIADNLSFSSTVTGRQVMSWIGEICGRFCRATADGDVEFAWYTPSGKTITVSGDPYYFENGLTYETYQTEKIGAVQLRLADSSDGGLWPTVPEGTNSYIITGNAILNSRISEQLLPNLQVIQNAIKDVTYTPCKVSIPANNDIRAGNTIDIVDKNGVRMTAYVMEKVQSGQKDTLECKGSPRRDSATATNNQSAAQKNAASQAYADSAAKNAVNSMTQDEVFNKLTNNGQLQGIFYQDGRWYVNFEFVQALNLIAGLITAGTLRSKDGSTYFNLDDNEIVTSSEGYKVVIKNGLINLLDNSGVSRISIERYAHSDGESYSIRCKNSNGSPVVGMGSGPDGPVFFADAGEHGSGAVGFKPTWKTINGVTYLVGE